MRTYRIICWHGNIKPEDRDSRTLSDGAQFLHPEDAVAFVRRVVVNGGEIHSVKIVDPATFAYRSIEEYDSIGKMSTDQINEIANRDRG